MVVGFERISAKSVFHHAGIRPSGMQRFPNPANCHWLLSVRCVAGRSDFVQGIMGDGVSWNLRM